MSYRPEGKKVERTVFKLVGMESCTTACSCDNSSQESVVYSETTFLGGVTGRYFTDAELTAMDAAVAAELAAKDAEIARLKEENDAKQEEIIGLMDQLIKGLCASEQEIKLATECKKLQQRIRELEADLYDAKSREESYEGRIGRLTAEKEALLKGREPFIEMVVQKLRTSTPPIYVSVEGEAAVLIAHAKKEARAAALEEAANAMDAFERTKGSVHGNVIRALKEE